MPVHLYGVVAPDASVPERAGRRGAKLRLITHDDLGVIVSNVAETARVGAPDLLAHARVLEDVVAHDTVVPMRFGVLLHDDDAVRNEFLAPEHDRLMSALHLFDETVQLSVRIRQDEEAALREVMKRWPDLLELRDRVRRLMPVQRLPHQMQLGEAVSDAVEDLSAELADALAPRLSAVAVATMDVRPQDVHEVLNAAYLVRRAEREQFDEAVGAIRRDFSGRISVRYVGPLPPYSFVTSEGDRSEAWA